MKEIKQQKFTLAEFNKKYPDDATCIHEIFIRKYSLLAKCPKCGKPFKYYRVRERKCYACQYCSNQLYPLAQTIFEKSDTSLRLWFFAIFLFSASKNGVAAKELQRQLGVTYKCAWRIANKVRTLFLNDDSFLENKVEVDETYIGGKHDGKRGRGSENKTIVLGMIERNGSAKGMVVPDVKTKTLMPKIETNVKKSAMVYTDDLPSYNKLGNLGFNHKIVPHSSRVYVTGKDIHTNNIEGFWSQLKRSIDGTYHSVSPKYLQEYVNEFSYRYSQRNTPYPLFSLLLGKI